MNQEKVKQSRTHKTEDEFYRMSETTRRNDLRVGSTPNKHEKWKRKFQPT